MERRRAAGRGVDKLPKQLRQHLRRGVDCLLVAVVEQCHDPPRFVITPVWVDAALGRRIESIGPTQNSTHAPDYPLPARCCVRARWQHGARVCFLSELVPLVWYRKSLLMRRREALLVARFLRHLLRAARVFRRFLAERVNAFMRFLKLHFELLLFGRPWLLLPLCGFLPLPLC